MASSEPSGPLRDTIKELAVADGAQEVSTTKEAGDESSASSQHLRADGSVLSPQPSTSPDDPLNWSWMKKHAIMLALIPGCMLSDWYAVPFLLRQYSLVVRPRA